MPATCTSREEIIPVPTPPRLRFAPSPTGDLHVGGARTALFNWLWARKHGGKMLLRIEDTDKARSTAESTRAIFDGLEWLGLDWDDEVVHQGANVTRHQNDVQRILESGAAYPCFCTPAELDARRKEADSRKESFKYDRRCDRLSTDAVSDRMKNGEQFVVRFRIPDGSTEWDDLVHGTISFPNKDVDDFVVLRSDRTPIYNLAVVSDDIAMGITLVMRGDDHISNTPKQIMLYRALSEPVPQFAHLPMIHGMDGKKLSKRHGATAVGDYQHLGIVPEAMVNFLALLGWSPGEDREIMSLEQMIELFSASGLQKKAAVFDTQKLEWMNGQYLSAMPIGKLEPRVTPAILAAGLATADQLRGERYLALLELLRVRARTIHDVVRQAVPYLSDSITYDSDAVAKGWKDPADSALLLQAVFDKLDAAADWTVGGLEAALRALAEERGTTAGKIFQPMRVALTGMSVSPGIFDVLVTLGREKSLERIRAAIARLTTL